MKKVVLMAFIVIFSCKEDKKLIKNAVSISIWKKEMLDDNSLLIELHFNNNSETNYLLPISSDYILENRKKIFNPVFGRIISSDFTDIDNYKIKSLLEDYTENHFYKGFSHESYKMAVYKDYEGYTNSLIFIPKKTEKKMFLIFNLYEPCKDSFRKCHGVFHDDLSKIIVGIRDADDIKVLDSLLKKEKIDYNIYRKSLYLKDSLFINR